MSNIFLTVWGNCPKALYFYLLCLYIILNFMIPLHLISV
ncbi:hypothetical protein TFUB4_02642 [Tannerella forsythia]|uniref:Uncharacterized protein n=1 Tax=Tannerella forsythia TaxID=28112 RepID=A0A1D3UXK0_TANFO|nr:hypothetical protein TFUB4_02642 [Tannerella forsythia]SCQ24771.1 hypothetical protein TFUB20_02676 [Tannerella forsythia]SCQ25392.1 hypothetical protein TFUB22_02696 [Tannerella forsythia]